MMTTSNGLIPPTWAYEVTNPLEFGTVKMAEEECTISFVQVKVRTH